jgi:hypothetical protein
MMANYIALEDKATQPVRSADGSLENFTLRIAGKPYRCQCLCNVFHKPDDGNLELYECNSCGQRFEAA